MSWVDEALMSAAQALSLSATSCWGGPWSSRGTGVECGSNLVPLAVITLPRSCSARRLGRVTSQNEYS